MSSFVNLIYRLPMEFIAQGFLLAGLAFLVAHRRFGDRRWFRAGVRLCLLLWFAAVLWITLLRRTPGAAAGPELIPLHSYRKLMNTGNREILRTNFMNVALFYPAGLLTASMFREQRPNWQRMLLTGALFALLSVGIEFLQFRFALGCPEIDDVLHNTVGTLLGTMPVVFRKLLCDPPPGGAE